MKKQYHQPTLIDYGRIDQVTAGAIGPNLDFTFSGGILNVDNNSPVCTSNTGYCLKFGS